MTASLLTRTEIREEEIRPEDLFSRFMELSAEDAENFFDRSKFVEVDCPACGHAGRENGFEKFSFLYGQCGNCGTLYVSPRPDPEELLRYYARSESQKFWINAILKQTGEKRQASIAAPNLERIEKLVTERGKAPRRVLDVGAAGGAFLSMWKARHAEAELIAVEPGAAAAQKCRDRGMTVFEDFVENAAGQEGAQGDMVTCFEVMEHVQDPLKFARSLCAVTAPGGMAVVTCLGADGFDIQLLWEKSRSVMPPYHLNFLSRRGMEELYSKAGFSKVEVFSPGRLDVEIVQKSIERGIAPELSRFESLLLSRGGETLKAFQKFLAENALSSHVWIIAHR